MQNQIDNNEIYNENEKEPKPDRCFTTVLPILPVPRL